MEQKSCFDSNFPLRKAGWLHIQICYMTASCSLGAAHLCPPHTACQLGPSQQLPQRAPLKGADWEQPNMLKQGQSFGPEPAPKDQMGHFYHTSWLWQKRTCSRAEQRHRSSIPTSSYSRMVCICTKYSHNKMTDLFTKKSSNE